MTPKPPNSWQLRACIIIGILIIIDAINRYTHYWPTKIFEISTMLILVVLLTYNAYRLTRALNNKRYHRYVAVTMFKQMDQGGIRKAKIMIIITICLCLFVIGVDISTFWFN